MNAYRMVLTAALLALVSSNAVARGLYDPAKTPPPQPSGTSATSGTNATSGTGPTGGTSFWQGSWGIEGTTPVVTVAASVVSYEGANRQTFAVANVVITGGKITFQVGSAQVSLAKRPDSNADMVSTIGANSSQPILLCKSAATHCP